MQKRIATTRFNNNTWKENQDFIHNQTHNQHYKCVYNVDQINSKISSEAIFFVLEMNNDENKILGIGLIKNNPTFQKYKIYQNDKYNKYCFTGKFRIDRTEMSEEEEIVMKELDTICFKGRRHFKRLRGIKIFSGETISTIHERLQITQNIIEYISDMFKRRYSS